MWRSNSIAAVVAGGGRLGTPGRGVTRYAPTGPAAYSNNAITRPSDVGETAMAVIVMRM